jgi:ABC-type Fe3+/spermidine/putrescine transport system ATPase subunit
MEQQPGGEGTVLSITGLSKYFGDFKAVDALDLSVGTGEMLALLGPSGCGKTTTLRMVSGLERPSEGEIQFAGTTFVSAADRVYLTPEKRNVGMVFQSYALWPHMTVAENVAYPLKLRRVNGTERRGKVDAVLELIGLSDLAAQAIPNLSGGQQQRVALARALVYEPSLMLFDEPFSNLDAQLRGQMRMELKSLRKKVKMTGMFVTHDQVEALSLADRVAIMNQGRIEQVGTPTEIYSRPATKFVRDFLGNVINLHATIGETTSEGGVTLSLAGPGEETLISLGGSDPVPPAGTPVEISIRPEDIEVYGAPPSGARNVVFGEIDELLFTGDRFEARIMLCGEAVVLELPSSGGFAEGQSICLRLQEDAITLWPAGGDDA